MTLEYCHIHDNGAGSSTSSQEHNLYMTQGGDNQIKLLFNSAVSENCSMTDNNVNSGPRSWCSDTTG